jgi:hypothetical protein
MELGVRVAVVPTLGEAEVIVGLLETEGIQAIQRAARGGESSSLPTGWTEILVPEADLDRARELIEPAAEEPPG